MQASEALGNAALAAIQAKYEKVKQMAYLLRTENKNAANADGSMSKEEQRDYLRKYEAELVSPKEVALRARGASNAGYHYLGCAKTFALMGEAFAKAILSLACGVGVFLAVIGLPRE